jgi:hypothetical protein
LGKLKEQCPLITYYCGKYCTIFPAIYFPANFFVLNCLLCIDWLITYAAFNILNM